MTAPTLKPVFLGRKRSWRTLKGQSPITLRSIFDCRWSRRFLTSRCLWNHSKRSSRDLTYRRMSLFGSRQWYDLSTNCLFSHVDSIWCDLSTIFFVLSHLDSTRYDLSATFCLGSRQSYDLPTEFFVLSHVNNTKYDLSMTFLCHEARQQYDLSTIFLCLESRRYYGLSTILLP